MTDTNLPELNRLDWLDALRGWAVLGVAAVQYAVQLFFFISALTISITYEAHIAKFGKTFRAQFSWFLKRFFRIAPLYYIAACFYTFERYEVYLLSHNKYGQAPDIKYSCEYIIYSHMDTICEQFRCTRRMVYRSGNVFLCISAIYMASESR